MIGRPRQSNLFLELLALLALACVLALSVNKLRPEGIPWREDWTAKKFASATKSGGRILLDLALAAQQSDSALFIDARLFEDYELGHIPGAQSLPFDPVSKTLEAQVKELPKDRPLILYCSGVSCSMAEELAEYIRDFGYKNALIMVEGFEGWSGAGYPIQKGKP